MKTTTRLLIACTTFFWLAAVCSAQQKPDLPGGYPTRPVRVLLGSSAGGGTDLITRRAMQRLSDAWGRSFVVENRPGADGAIAYDAVVKAAPDGYMLYGGGTSIITGWPTKRLPSDPRKVIDPVVETASLAYILVVNPSLPVRSLGELVALAKSRPGALSYASPGAGSAAYLGMEFFRAKAGMDMLHVPYKGTGQAIVDLISGQVQLMFIGPNGGGPHIRSRKLKPLAVTGARRMGAYPEVPTLSESGVAGLSGFELSGFEGIFAPAGTPAPILAAINHEVLKIMTSSEMKERLSADGSEPPQGLSPSEFKAKFVKKVDEWEKFISTSGIRLAE